MTVPQIRKLVVFLNGLLQERAELSKTGDIVGIDNTALSMVRNILSANISSEHRKSLGIASRLHPDEDGRPFPVVPSPWECIKDTLVRGSKDWYGSYNDRRAICMYQVGRVITARYLRLPTMLNKYEGNGIARAVLEWRLENQI